MGRPWRKYARVLFIRDEWTCQICNKRLNPLLQGEMDPDAPTIDHIIPTSKGGSNRRENQQTACSACNQAKDNRVLGEVR